MTRFTRPDHPFVVVLTAVAAIVGIVTGVASMTGSTDSQAGPTRSFSARMINPSKGAVVGQFVDVEYAITGRLPVGTRGILVIQDPIDQWWVWGALNPKERRRVQIGLAEDSGRVFDVGIVFTADPPVIGRPLQQRPPGVAYTSVTVTRE